ncbi:hypothetical protein SLE2022_084690 [Rubroshorea leprosula]
MHKQSLMVDAWMREAQEALKLVEDVETRVKNKNPHQEQQQEDENLRLTEIARSKLFEVGVKVDRLESLLHNPPSKPILTNEDLEYRWKMLSDIQLRTRVLALSLYAIPSPNRPQSLHTACTVENIRTVNRDEPDQMKASISEDDPEMLRPLISDSEKGQVQIKQYSTTSMSLLQNAFWTVCVLLGSAILIFILILICAVIYPR